MSEKDYPLQNIIQAGNYSVYTTATALYLPKLIQTLLSSDDKILRTFHVGGLLVKTLDETFDLIESYGGRKTVVKQNGDYVFTFKDTSFVEIDHYKSNNNITINGQVLDPKLIDMALILEKDYVTKVKTNLVFSIIQTSTGFDIRNMGDGSSPLIKENYLPETLEEVDYVISSFKKSPPCGRICILNGEAGTGKTHLVRSILSQLDCVFLIIPSNLIDSLDKPQFMPVLLNIKRDHEKPIVMIIEDGDACLVPRKSDNISTIAALLNLSDGILGSIIDIKMIISTNAEIREMDQAIMRPGRLCKNIHVGALPFEQASKVYQRLMKNDEAKLDYRKYYTLAEIYNVVNNVDFVSTINPTTRRVIGFSNRNPDVIMNSISSEMKIK